MPHLIKKSLAYVIYFWIVFLTPTFFLRSGLIDVHLLIQYILIYLTFYISVYCYYKIFNRKNPISIFGAIFPVIVINVYGLYINFEGIFPFVFPTTTIIFAFAFLQIFTKKILLLNFINVLIIICFTIFLYPKIATRKDLVKVNESINNYTLYSFSQSDSLEVHIDYNENILIDFMFINCEPCRQKLDYLQELGKDEIVYIIVNGDIDSFSAFKNFYQRNSNNLKNVHFLYDTSGRFTNQFGIEGYPFEIIINNKFIVAKESGFPPFAKNEYIALRKTLLD